MVVRFRSRTSGIGLRRWWFFFNQQEPSCARFHISRHYPYLCLRFHLNQTVCIMYSDIYNWHESPFVFQIYRWYFMIFLAAVEDERRMGCVLFTNTLSFLCDKTDALWTPFTERFDAETLFQDDTLEIDICIWWYLLALKDTPDSSLPALQKVAAKLRYVVLAKKWMTGAASLHAPLTFIILRLLEAQLSINWREGADGNRGDYMPTAMDSSLRARHYATENYHSAQRLRKHGRYYRRNIHISLVWSRSFDQTIKTGKTAGFRFADDKQSTFPTRPLFFWIPMMFIYIDFLFTSLLPVWIRLHAFDGLITEISLHWFRLVFALPFMSVSIRWKIFHLLTWTLLNIIAVIFSGKHRFICWEDLIHHLAAMKFLLFYLFGRLAHWRHIRCYLK